MNPIIYNNLRMSKIIGSDFIQNLDLKIKQNKINKLLKNSIYKINKIDLKMENLVLKSINKPEPKKHIPKTYNI